MSNFGKCRYLKKMKKIHYKKLIRDKIPQRIKESGGEYSCKRLNIKEFKRELVKKLKEESIGVFSARGKKEFVSEIGDLLDVIGEIKKVFKISSDELKISRKKEYVRKGGFKKRLFLEWAEDTGYKSNETK